MSILLTQTNQGGVCWLVRSQPSGSSVTALFFSGEEDFLPKWTFFLIDVSSCFAAYVVFFLPDSLSTYTVLRMN